MTTITIPKELTKKGDLILIPRKEYEEFYQWKEVVKLFKKFTPTPAQKRDLKNAREDYKQKKIITLNELKRRLEIKN